MYPPCIPHPGSEQTKLAHYHSQSARKSPFRTFTIKTINLYAPLTNFPKDSIQIFLLFFSHILIQKTYALHMYILYKHLIKNNSQFTPDTRIILLHRNVMRKHKLY